MLVWARRRHAQRGAPLRGGGTPRRSPALAGGSNKREPIRQAGPPRAASRTDREQEHPGQVAGGTEEHEVRDHPVRVKMIGAMGQTGQDGSKGVVTLAALYGAGEASSGRASRNGSACSSSTARSRGRRRAGRPLQETPSPMSTKRRRPLRAALLEPGTASTAQRRSGRVERTSISRNARLRGYIEEFLARASRSGGVVLGRGGMVVLRAVPGRCTFTWAGPGARASSRRWRIEGIDRETAERRRGGRGQRRGSTTSGAHTASTATTRASTT